MKLVFFLLIFTSSVFAQEIVTLEPVEVTEERDREPLQGSDTASLLEMEPGISLKSGGGLSSLPVIHGMADDRINIKVDGAMIASSCPNHMNPALSYIDPSKVATMETMAGITPVSHGGDSIGGSIIVKSKKLLFSKYPESLRQNLNLTSFFKSNNENRGASLNYEIAAENLYFGYSGFDERANNYRRGNGKRIKSTLYAQNNQSLTLGKKMSSGVLSLKLTRAVVPYEGFVNQYMDLEDNVSNLANLNYQGSIGKINIESTFFYQHTNHYMNMISSQRAGSMPMYTRSDQMGYNVKASIPLTSQHTLNVGSDFDRYRLDDWWPAVAGSMMMGPGTYESVNGGKRDRLGLFIEANSEWSNSFTTNLGLRTDIVSMDTGNVRGYNGSNNLPADADAFNSRDHSKKDHNYDATLLGTYKVSSVLDIELGIARKTRSPNLYERYAWAGSVTDPSTSMSAAMDMMMINWFGDGNGYVGDINLKPEVAQTISTSFIFHDQSSKDWEIKLTPYYTEIENFIDADVIGSSMGNNFLKFANHDAVIFGADLSLKTVLINSKSWGDVGLKAVGGYTRGYRKDGKADLYHLMPLNGKISLIHSLDKWTTDFTAHLTAPKKQVNDLRLEPTTAGYALLDLGTSYQATKLIQVNLAIMNLLDHDYLLPLGGNDLVNHSSASRTPLAAMGRSINTSVSIDFF